MSLKEKLQSLIKQAEACETMEELEPIAKEIEETRAAIELAERKQGVLDAMRADEPVATGRATLGAKAARAVAEKGAARGERVDVTVKADTGAAPAAMATPTGAYLGSVLTQVDPEVQDGPRRQLTVADLFGQETTEMRGYTYFTEGAATGAPAPVAEGAEFPVISFAEPVEHTDSVKKIGCVYKDTDELLEDAGRLAQSIDNRALYMLGVTEEDQLLSGTGTGTNITGLLSTSGLQVGEWSTLDGLLASIKRAKTAVKKNTPGFAADAVLMNDEDWDDLTLLKDANGWFIMGGPATGAYGNATLTDPTGVWSVPVVATQAVPKGTVVVGAFKQGGTVVRNGAVAVDVTNSNEDDFTHGRVAIRPSERLLLAVRYPAAFVKLTYKAAAADGKE